MKKVIIIGAGPAGLTAGYDLLSKSSDYDVTIVEESSVVGGLCARFENEENVLDAGGHMYISNNSAVKQFWYSVLPAQGVPSSDDLVLDRYCKIHNGGPDPEVSEDVLLSREKLTRIYKDNKFYESPVKFNKDAVKNFGFANSIKTGFSQIGNNVFKHKELSLEDYYINRFGKQLYNMFIEEYLEKIWGKEPSRINSEWGVVAERSLIAPVISTEKNNNRDYEKLPAPYATRYYYPKYGAYQLWETAADRFIEMGGSIHKNCKVTGITTGANKIISVRCSADGDEFVVGCDYLISSMPIRDLILGMDDVDGNVSLAAENLSYRGMVSVCVELTELNWKNDTEDYKTVDDIIPDSVLYISNPNVKVSRIQVYNNFSPYMIRNSKHYYLGLNYYCNEGDYYWSMGNRDWKKTVVNDLVKLGIIKSEESIVGYNKTKYNKAFPTYYDGYEGLDKIVKYLNKYENLFCVGRNGQHRFSSIDEVMKTSFEAVKNILGNVTTKDNIWKANEKNENEDKLYNSALLSGEGEYKGNYVPLQKKIDFDNNEENKDYVPPRRMRRPMMTPIKKADPNKLSEPIVLNDSVVIAARPEKSIPISEPDEEMVQSVPAAPRFDGELEENITFETVNEDSSVNNTAFEEKVEAAVDAPVEDNQVNEEPQIDLFAAAQESIEQEELEHKENAYVDETEEENENVAAALVAEESKEESHKKPELTNEFLDELLGLDFGDKENKSVNKAVDNVALVAEENVEASELDNFDVVDKIDAAIDEEIASKAKEATEAVEESAEAETEIADVVEEVQETEQEENIEETLEPVAEENEETTAAWEETIEDSAEDQVEEILETENVENAEEATVTEAEENAEESSENQVEELLETEIEETVEESPETEIEENVEESSENQAEETLEAEIEENVDESSDNQAEELLETEAEENTVASAETSESAKEIDAVAAKTEFTYKNPSSKERRSKRNFSFDILSMSDEEPVTEKKEEKVKKESDNDGFSLPGGGRSVFSRRSRSSSSNQNSSRRNRINLAELSDSTESREENITEIKDKSEEKTEEVKAFDSEVTNIETNAAEEVSKESFAEEAKESIAEETKESIAEETKESIAEETKESLPEEIIENSDNENSVEESEVKEETEEKTEESSEESAAKTEEAIESKEKNEDKESKKGKSSFGRTTNFKADTESKVERLVTREQAIGDDLDSEKVEFSRVEKFKTDDLADATNPHERFIKKDESIKDGPKGTFRVTSSFNSADFPEEKRVERPSYWDKELIYKAKEEAKQKELEEAAKAKEKTEAEAKAKAEAESEENEEANQNVSGEVLEDISKEETKTDTLTDEKAEEVSFEDTAEETVEDAIEEEQTEENSVEEISEESEEVTFEDTAEETTEDTIEEEQTEENSVEEISEESEEVSFEENVAEETANEESLEENAEEPSFEEAAEETFEEEQTEENSNEEISEESEEVSFEETVVEETANEESLEENAEEPSFEETAEETFEEEQTEENSNEEISEESEEVSFEETVVEETPIEEVSEETSYEETNEEIVEESSFEETADEAIEDAAEDLEETSFEETPVETTEETAEETSFEETAAESEFEKAAEEMNEEEIDDLSVIDEQAASKSIVKSWQNRYNGVGTSYIHEKKDDDRVVRSGSISNDLYGQNFALSSVGKKGIMDHELDDLDGGKEYVTKSSSKGTIIKSESYSEPEKQRPEKDLSAFKIIKESDTRFGNSEKKEEKAEASVEPVNPATEKPVDTPVSVKPEVTPAPAPVKPADSIFPSPAKPVGEKRNDFLKKDIDTSIVFRNARVIKTTKITRNIDEEPQFKKEEKKEKVYSDKQKVIAVIRNGEIIPVNEDKKEEIPAEPVAAKKPAKAENTKASRKKKKRGKNKKDAEDSSEEMMQAPISVMLDAKEAASMTEPLENPVARTRNFKI